MRLPNPLIAASGCFGYGLEYADIVDLSTLGGIAVKGLFGKKAVEVSPIIHAGDEVASKGLAKSFREKIRSERAAADAHPVDHSNASEVARRQQMDRLSHPSHPEPPQPHTAPRVAPVHPKTPKPTSMSSFLAAKKNGAM